MFCESLSTQMEPKQFFFPLSTDISLKMCARKPLEHPDLHAVLLKCLQVKRTFASTVTH